MCLTGKLMLPLNCPIKCLVSPWGLCREDHNTAQLQCNRAFWTADCCSDDHKIIPVMCYPNVCQRYYKYPS